MLDLPLTPAPLSAGPTRDEDVALRDGLVRGDRGAWATFQSRFGRLVTATIGRVVRRFSSCTTSEDVREIQSNFYVELLSNDCSKLRAYQPDRGVRLGTWLSMLASHAAYDFLRRRRREPFPGAELEVERLVTTGPSPHDAVELSEQAGIAEVLLRGFSTKDREFLELFYCEGLCPDQIASRMGISVKTVYTKKHKIQGRLTGLLQGHRLAS